MSGISGSTSALKVKFIDVIENDPDFNVIDYLTNNVNIEAGTIVFVTSQDRTTLRDIFLKPPKAESTSDDENEQDTERLIKFTGYEDFFHKKEEYAKDETTDDNTTGLFSIDDRKILYLLNSYFNLEETDNTINNISKILNIMVTYTEDSKGNEVVTFNKTPTIKEIFDRIEALEKKVDAILNFIQNDTDETKLINNPDISDSPMGELIKDEITSKINSISDNFINHTHNQFVN